MTKAGDTVFLGDVTLGGHAVNDIAVAADAAGTSDSTLVSQGYVNARSVGTTLTSWTPILRGASTAGTFTYTSNIGRYMIVGPIVWIWAELVWSAIGTSPVGDMTVELGGGGLPITPQGSRHWFTGISELNGVTYTGSVPFGVIDGNNDEIRISYHRSGDNTTIAVQGSDISTAGTIMLDGWYEAQ